MSKIKIKNFGPVKNGLEGDDEWLNIEKVTVFTGNQGSGKSTVAKLISTFTWIEKALVRGDYNTKWFERKNKLQNQYLNYHRLENYLQVNGKNSSKIDYEGDAYTIRYHNGSLDIHETANQVYTLPQIMYVPAERNFIAYVKTPRELKLSSDSLKEFLTEFENAKNDLKGIVKLPINNTIAEYDKLNDTLNIRGEEYKVKLTEASSGFQSFVPLYLVSAYLAKSVKIQSEANKEPMSSEEIQRFKKGVEEIWGNQSLTDEQKRIALSVLSSKFNKAAFINIVEEPEQNLFPASQRQMLNSLLEFNNMNEANKLILTTHSPYLINYLTLAVKANGIKSAATNAMLRNKLEAIVPVKSTVEPVDVAIYEMDEKNGSIKKLKHQNNLPSDENELNEMLGESNDLFAQLLDIQQQI